MRIAIVGASGNAGTALLRRLQQDQQHHELIGIARRKPDAGAEPYAGAAWHSIDVGSVAAPALLEAVFAGCDAVVHLGWAIQPNHHQDQLRRINVTGSINVFEAACRAGVPHLVYASSVGAYSPGPKDRRVGEEWPTGGIATSHYSRHKAQVETALDRIEAAHPGTAVARLRPGLIFQSGQAQEVGRYFLGPLLPVQLSRLRVPVLPLPRQLVFQAVHADDVADAYFRVLQQKARGAFNVAAEPVLDGSTLPPLVGARRAVQIPLGLLRGLVAASWRLHLQRSDPGWVDMGAQVPLMDTSRARNELGWSPSKTSQEAVSAVLGGMQQGAGVEASAPLRPGNQLPTN
ncbi:NAD-dependent epimerase/dehydratase family protein [Paenarthrobacter sp. DKR-5]|uniref:NAD-dependent epimerase/dehydratase family protein n=1 Tax=Paenarthrobacter sp. DKR-5 TaxID=2835535 RepID=UPI001BDD44BB|nr:NAD-dependent epimerase/dehydratase family protein [Paenarthrobacter sp. DKR-5]MBT1004205.1 NAD-dependent epimerase/dehydratase family protein [Paenarthrobacter sp. DKR-5]